MTPDELTDAEINALSEDGLRILADGGVIDDLPETDIRRLYEMNEPEKPSWFQENVAQPVMGKLGEIAGAAGSLSSSNIRAEALNQMIMDGRITKEEADAGLVEPGLAGKVGAASELFLQNAFDSLRVTEENTTEDLKSRANPEILADVQAMDSMGASLGAMNAVALAKGQQFTWEDGNAGVLEALGNTITAGEQAVARTALTALGSIGAIPRDKAIQMLSQTQVHASDLVDHFWVPDSAVGKIGRGVVGFIGDIALDPLSYLTLGAGPVLNAAFKNGPVKIGNRFVTDPKLISRMERQALLAQQDVMTLVKSNGDIVKLDATDDALQTLNAAVSDKGLAGLDGEIVNKFAEIDPTLGEQVKGIFQSRQNQKGTLRSLADRETSLNFGIKLPFTNIGVETQVPLFGQGTRWAATGALGVKDWSFDSAARLSSLAMEKSDLAAMAGETAINFGDAVSNTFQALKTFTTRPLWDSASNGFLNKKYGNQIWAKRQMDEAIQEVGNDPEDARLMVQWLNQEPTLADDDLIKRFIEKDMVYLSDENYIPVGIDRGDKELMAQIRGSEFIKDQASQLRKRLSLETGTIQGPIDISAMTDDELMQEFANSTLGEFVSPIKPTKKNEKYGEAIRELSAARKMAQDTMTRLELKNPKAAKRVRQIREQFVDRIYEMEKRGIPFRVLNPFDETIPVNERAFGYFPHIMNPDYLDELGRPKYEAALNAFQDHQVELGLVDATQAGRRDRRDTLTIIDSIKKASGIDAPIFVNDPISASYSRMEDMDNIIAQYDMFNEILPLAKIVRPSPALEGISKSRGMERLTGTFQAEDPGRGWVEFDWKDFASPVMKKYGGVATVETTMKGKVRSELLGKEMAEDFKAKEFLQFKSFLPQEYKVALAEGASIYFPDEVATRIGYIMQRPKSGVVNSAIDTFNYLFRNGALFGFGYQGMNMFSNLTTYMTARADLVKLPQASKFLFDAKNNAAKVRNKTYSFGKGNAKITLNGEQLYDLAVENGVLANSAVTEADIISDVWDMVATTKSTRDKKKFNVKNRFDLWSGFKLNRHFAEMNDNISRMGLFMDSLDKGYTVKAAKERVDTYFYDFRDMPQGQRALSNVMPFSSFMSKTAESVARRAMKLDLTPVTIPFYASEVLSGAFVDSYEERQMLKSQLPFYANHQELGDALPGGKQLLVELPFILPSLKTFLNPEDSVHPLIQSLALATTAISQGNSADDQDFDAAQMDSALFKSKWDEFLGMQLQNLIPPSVKMPLTIAQMANPDEVRYLPLDFIKKYKGQDSVAMGTAAENPYSATLSLNAEQFGQFAKEQSPNWFYNAVMYGQFKEPYITPGQLGEKEAIYGRFVKSRMRDISLGFVRMNNMDTAIVSRMAAVQRQIAKTEKAIQKVNIDANILRDPLASPKLRMKLSGRADRMTNEYIAESIELQKRMAALEGFYGYYISQQKSGGMVLEMISNALKPEAPLTEQQVSDQNSLIEAAPDMIPGRVKKLELQMMGEQ